MKRIYYEMKREEWDKPFVMVEVYFPDAQENSEMPALIHLMTGHFGGYADIIHKSQWVIHESRLYRDEASAIRKAIRLTDNVYESLMKGEKSG